MKPTNSQKVFLISQRNDYQKLQILGALGSESDKAGAIAIGSNQKIERKNEIKKANFFNRMNL